MFYVNLAKHASINSDQIRLISVFEKALRQGNNRVFSRNRFRPFNTCDLTIFRRKYLRGNQAPEYLIRRVNVQRETSAGTYP